MTREEAKKLLPIMQAFIEGKTIEEKDCHDTWNSLDNLRFLNHPENYRIKPEPKYRPFKDADECWQEMQKHQPFGWVKAKDEPYLSVINSVESNVHTTYPVLCLKFDDAFGRFTFCDGTPFGIKEQEESK